MAIRFDVLGDPPSPAEIRARRAELGSAEDDGFIAFLLTPLPFVDLAVGAVAGGVSHRRNGEERERLADAPRALARDWSGSEATRAYAAKVQAQGRPLVNAEVEALDAHLSAERTIHHAVGQGIGMVARALAKAI